MILDIFIEKFGQIFVRVLSHTTSHDSKIEFFYFFNYFHDRQNGQNIVDLHHDWNSVRFRTHHGPRWPGLNYSSVSMGPVSLNQAWLHNLIFQWSSRGGGGTSWTSDIEFIKMQYQGQSVLCKIALYFLAWPLFQLALCDQNYPAI